MPQVLQTQTAEPQVFPCQGGRVEVVETSGWCPFWLTAFTPDGAVWDQAFARTDREVAGLVADMTADLNLVAQQGGAR